MEGFGTENGYELSRCEFVKEGPDWYLRVFVDRLTDGKYGYMTSDDCELVSRYLSSKLDEADPITQNYYLEVSSPGLDRLLVSDKDLLRFTGETVNIKLYEAINGKKTISGILKQYQDGILTVETDEGTDIDIPKIKTSKVNLAVII